MISPFDSYSSSPVPGDGGKLLICDGNNNPWNSKFIALCLLIILFALLTRPRSQVKTYRHIEFLLQSDLKVRSEGRVRRSADGNKPRL